jgi:Fe-S-cluster-containing hydrogenase component 2
MIENTGVATKEDLAQVEPSLERREKGPVAVFECFQEIPCNPCYTSCRVGAVEEFKDINDLPQVDHDKCTGCGVCISHCPGLAIFVVDQSHQDYAVVRVPYEFLPVPSEGQEVDALDREGNVVCRARVRKVQNAKSQDKTLVVWLEVPHEAAMTARNFRVVKDR